MKKLAVVGSRSYKDVDRIRKIVNLFVEKYGHDNLTIVSGGCPTGADYLIKEIAINLNLKYVEFPPVHKSHNKYCIKTSKHYNKPYNVRNFFDRNSEIAEYCDFLIAFILKDVKANGTMDTVKKTRLLGKLVQVFED